MTGGSGYSSNFTLYSSTVLVSSGSYALKMYDSYGDGWNGGTISLKYVSSGADIAGGGLPTGNSGSLTFDTDCSPCTPSCDGRQCGDDGCGGVCGYCPTGQGCTPEGLCQGGSCSITVRIDTVSYGSEVSWSLEDVATGETVASGSGYASNSTYITVVEANSGPMIFHMMDAWGDGWNGGSATIFQTNSGATIAYAQLYTGSSGSEAFSVDCSSCEPLCAAGGCGSDGCGGECGTCSGSFECIAGVCTDPSAECSVSVTWTPGSWAYEASWNMQPAGISGGGSGSTTQTFSAASGTVQTVTMSDSYGDGWNGGYISYSTEGGTTSGTIQLSSGSSGVDSFEVTCP